MEQIRYFKLTNFQVVDRTRKSMKIKQIISKLFNLYLSSNQEVLPMTEETEPATQQHYATTSSKAIRYDVSIIDSNLLAMLAASYICGRILMDFDPKHRSLKSLGTISDTSALCSTYSIKEVQMDHP